MKTRVLFSPVGNTDPIRDCYDGPLLQIVRHYRPEDVYLFLSKQMQTWDERDDRYAWCIRQIMPECRVHKILSGVENPHDFNCFLGIFGQKIRQIGSEHPGAEILLNISSGTPQMQMTLAVEAINANGLGVKAIQVVTPAKGSNHKTTPAGDDFQREEAMETNIDQSGGEDNRCQEINLLLVRRNNVAEGIRALARSYEYGGASLVCRQEEDLFAAPQLIDPEVKKLIEHAELRVALRFSEAQKVLSQWRGKELFPVKQATAMEISEFFMSMKIKQRRGELAEFFLKLTPMLFKLTHFYLKEVLRYPLERIVVKGRHGTSETIKMDMVRAFSPGLADWLNSQYPRGGFRDSDLGTNSMLRMLEYLAQQEEYAGKIPDGMLGRLWELRQYEERIRHSVAHDIMSVNEAFIARVAQDLCKENSSFAGRKDSKQLLEDVEGLMRQMLGSQGKGYIFIYDVINEELHHCLA